MNPPVFVCEERMGICAKGVGNSLLYVSNQSRLLDLPYLGTKHEKSTIRREAHVVEFAVWIGAEPLSIGLICTGNTSRIKAPELETQARLALVTYGDHQID